MQAGNWQAIDDIQKSGNKMEFDYIDDFREAPTIREDSWIGAETSGETIDGDMTVAAGATLTIEPGTTLLFSAGSQLIVNGTLDADDATLTASGTSWDGVYFSDGDGTLTNVDILDVDAGAAVTVNDGDVTITTSEIENTGTNGYDLGVWALGSGSVELYFNDLTVSEGPAVLVQNSATATLHDNNIIMQGSTDGTVYAENYADVDFYRPGVDNQGENIIKGGPGLYAYGNTVLNAGSSAGYKDANSLCQGLGLTVESGGVIYARFNYWWNNTIPTPTIIGSGNVYASNSRGSSNSACNALSAPVVAGGDLSGSDRTDSSTEPPDARLFEAKALAAQRRYDAAAALLGQIIEDDATAPAAHAALLELGMLMKRADLAAAASLVRQLASRETVLRPAAMRLVAYQHARQGDLAGAHAALDEIVRRYAQHPAAFEARLHKVYLHIEQEHYDVAEALLGTLEETGSFMDLSAERRTRALLLARRALALETEGASKPSARTTEPGVGARAAKRIETAAPEAPNQSHALEAEAYPNPFNPQATIRYAVPEAGPVTLRVYDVLGRAVATLADGPRAAGTHEAVFEATGLPSGTYVYRLEAADQVRNGTLVVLK